MITTADEGIARTFRSAAIDRGGCPLMGWSGRAFVPGSRWHLTQRQFDHHISAAAMHSPLPTWVKIRTRVASVSLPL